MTELLGDPMTQAMMRADHVDRTQLRTMLLSAAVSVRARPQSSRRRRDPSVRGALRNFARTAVRRLDSLLGAR